MLKVENSEVFRNNIRKELNKKLSNEKYASNLEKGIFNYSLREADRRNVLKKWDNFYFMQIYIAHLRSILSNLNSSVLDDIQNGIIKPEQVAFMTHQELSPDRWASLIDAKSKRDQQKFTNNMEAGTDTFTCRKCKGNRCTFYTQQVKCSDEATTIFVSCLDCGQKWKTS
jgi:transcription elongation factor S-II